jgi:hypothetical protein
MWKLFTFNREKVHYFIVGIITAMAIGSIFPLYAILLGRIMIVLAMPDFHDEAMEIVYWFLIIAVIAFFLNVI